jgi:hypothetical protein
LYDRLWLLVDCSRYNRPIAHIITTIRTELDIGPMRSDVSLNAAKFWFFFRDETLERLILSDDEYVILFLFFMFIYIGERGEKR